MEILQVFFLACIFHNHEDTSEGTPMDQGTEYFIDKIYTKLHSRRSLEENYRKDKNIDAG